jgi:ribokinase
MIVVVGSVNRDLVVTSETLPGPGETVLGSGHIETAGGKGANQAVAAARLGASVSFVGRVGDDDAGRMLAAAFEADGVDIENLSMSEEAPTGLAVITVDESGENTIVVSPGANGLVGVGDVSDAGAVLRSAAVTLLQLEIPLGTVAEAAQTAGGAVILNAAPAQPLPEDLLAAVNVLVVNQSELEALAGSQDPDSAQRLPVPVTVVTLGAEGAALVAGGSVTRFPAPRVDVVDTTGAGDAFCGALAAGIDAGLEITEALPRAVLVGALATTAVGARTAMPTKDEMDAHR